MRLTNLQDITNKYLAITELPILLEGMTEPDCYYIVLTDYLVKAKGDDNYLDYCGEPTDENLVGDILTLNINMYDSNGVLPDVAVVLVGTVEDDGPGHYLKVNSITTT